MKWLKQRTTWVGITAIGTGGVLIYHGNLNEGVQTIIGGLGLIFMREAITKAGK